VVRRGPNDHDRRELGFAHLRGLQLQEMNEVDACASPNEERRTPHELQQ